MFLEGREIGNTFGASMNHAYWLIDGGALTEAETQMLSTNLGVHSVYDHLKDESAMRMGPWLIASETEVGDSLAAALRADDLRRWGLNELHTSVKTDVLKRHLMSLVYAWTSDGQRFFLRFADGRSMRAVWSVLNARQRSGLQGPIQRWRTTNRSGEPVDLCMTPTDILPEASSSRLTFTDTQLGQLLDRVWPDQLLSAVLEEEPSLAESLSTKQLHDLATQTCLWLKDIEEERYPRQKAALAYVLTHGQGSWIEPSLVDRA